MGMFTETPLFDDPSLPTGWYRKVVQRQTGATAGQWDVYVYNPEGKKFRSRNELRAYLTQIGSSLNSEDFDFSVKGKGHHNKGKSPAKKSLTENSKENIVCKKNKISNQSPGTLKTNSTASEKPKQELRKGLRSEAKVEAVEQPEEKYVSPDEDEEENDEISNVKLKVKVGYTATGAMIRPALNDGRKKKRRFRNLNIKKKREVKPTKPAKGSLSVKGTNQSIIARKLKEEKRDMQSLRLKQSKSSKTKPLEPIPGPSGLQRLKRSPRRLLKRKLSDTREGKGSAYSEDDDEDLDYVCSLYDNHTSAHPSSEDGTGASSTPTKQLKEDLTESKEEENNEVAYTKPDPDLDASEQHDNLIDDCKQTKQIMPSEEDPLAIDSVNISNSLSIASEQVEMEHMQVVVIGDSDECHNYAKPHGV